MIHQYFTRIQEVLFSKKIQGIHTHIFAFNQKMKVIGVYFSEDTIYLLVEINEEILKWSTKDVDHYVIRDILRGEPHEHFRAIKE